jgi:hypothetical protein
VSATLLGAFAAPNRHAHQAGIERTGGYRPGNVCHRQPSAKETEADHPNRNSQSTEQVLAEVDLLEADWQRWLAWQQRLHL